MKWGICLVLSLINVFLWLGLYQFTGVEASFVGVGIGAVLALFSAIRMNQCR